MPLAWAQRHKRLSRRSPGCRPRARHPDRNTSNDGLLMTCLGSMQCAPRRAAASAETAATQACRHHRAGGHARSLQRRDRARGRERPRPAGRCIGYWSHLHVGARSRGRPGTAAVAGAAGSRQDIARVIGRHWITGRRRSAPSRLIRAISFAALFNTSTSTAWSLHGPRAHRGRAFARGSAARPSRQKVS